MGVSTQLGSQPSPALSEQRMGPKVHQQTFWLCDPGLLLHAREACRALTATLNTLQVLLWPY